MVMSTAYVYSVYPSVRVQRVSIVLMAMSFAVPLLLERVGVLQRSYLFRDGEMIILPNVCHFSELTTLTYLSTATLLFLLIGSASVRRIRNALNAAEERLSLQAWQLRQLVPERARQGFRTLTPALKKR
jgi:serine/threonine-protein kinase